MFNTFFMLLHCVLVFTMSIHVQTLILTHMYSMHSDLLLNPGVTEAKNVMVMLA
jgi:hypothetical protein